MRMSQLWTKTSKTAPSDEVSKNAQLLIRAGFVYKEMAGVYAYLPLGVRVLERIKQIIRQEMAALGSQEIAMTTLQHKDVWQTTGRWDDQLVDIWFKTQLKDGTAIGLGWSHEEPIVQMLRQFMHSYKDMPVSVYQIQTKLRNELRAKSGIMRGREFIMKDMYSFHTRKEDLDAYYQRVIAAYQRCYDRLGIGHDTYVTFASGGAFTQFSHEFQTVCSAGEDYIYLHRPTHTAINEEVLAQATRQLGISQHELERVKTAEVGNIFNFGRQKTDDMGLYVTDQQGQRQSIFMGSYGIGVSRVMGVIVEKFADEKGLVWPAAVAPYTFQLVAIGQEGSVLADQLYDEMTAAGVAVLYDDRAERPGVKFADAELMGAPWRLVISDRALKSDGLFELVERSTGEIRRLPLAPLREFMHQQRQLDS